MKTGAIISDCKRYRYRLWRIWNENKPLVLFIMLNPSKADSNADDPTIRRCMRFAAAWGYGGMYVGNLFAYRSTEPKGLMKTFDPVGRENDYHLACMSEKCEIAVCAWGNKSIVDSMRPEHTPLEFVKAPLYYIELSKDGIPKHPLYLKKSLKPKRFDKGRINATNVMRHLSYHLRKRHLN